jgi:hypothetical protein
LRQLRGLRELMKYRVKNTIYYTFKSRNLTAFSPSASSASSDPPALF